MERRAQRLATDPSSVDLKKLSGRGWRLRVGQWRAIISLNSDGVMLVQRVLNRRDAYP